MPIRYWCDICSLRLNFNTRCTEPPVRTGDGKFQSNTYVSSTVRLYLSFSGVSAVRNIIITFAAPAWVHSTTPLDRIESMSGENATPRIVECTFFTRTAIPPASMKVSATAVYSTQDSSLRSASMSFALPMCLACRVQPAQTSQSAAFKLTLHTNQDAVFEQRK